MSATTKHFQPVYDENGKLLGVWLSPELWRKAEAVLSPAVDKALDLVAPETRPQQPEPLKDWLQLAQSWDFNYALPADVLCQTCGAASEDWQKDDPRKFRLRSATMGGLVNFECCSCHSRIIKKHFKNKVDVECRPYVDN